VKMGFKGFTYSKKLLYLARLHHMTQLRFDSKFLPEKGGPRATRKEKVLGEVRRKEARENNQRQKVSLIRSLCPYSLRSSVIKGILFQTPRETKGRR